MLRCTWSDSFNQTSVQISKKKKKVNQIASFFECHAPGIVGLCHGHAFLGITVGYQIPSTLSAGSKVARSGWNEWVTGDKGKKYYNVGWNVVRSVGRCDINSTNFTYAPPNKATSVDYRSHHRGLRWLTALAANQNAVFLLYIYSVWGDWVQKTADKSRMNVGKVHPIASSPFLRLIITGSLLRVGKGSLRARWHWRWSMSSLAVRGTCQPLENRCCVNLLTLMLRALGS